MLPCLHLNQINFYLFPSSSVSALRFVTDHLEVAKHKVLAVEWKTAGIFEERVDSSCTLPQLDGSTAVIPS